MQNDTMRLSSVLSTRVRLASNQECKQFHEQLLLDVPLNRCLACWARGPIQLQGLDRTIIRQKDGLALMIFQLEEDRDRAFDKVGNDDSVKRRKAPSFDRQRFLSTRYTNFTDKLRALKEVNEMWSDVDTSVARCLTLCPAREVLSRTRLLPFEKSRYVKEYKRASADQLQSDANDLRPAYPTLLQTVAFLCGLCDGENPCGQNGLTPDLFHYISHRLQAVRKDLVQQNVICDFDSDGDHVGREAALQCLEVCIRFHVYAALRLQGQPVDSFSPTLNDSQIRASLSSLLQCCSLKSSRRNDARQFRALQMIQASMIGANPLFATDVDYVHADPFRDLALAVHRCLRTNNAIRLWKIISITARSNPMLACSILRLMDKVSGRCLEVLVRYQPSSGVCGLLMARHILASDDFGGLDRYGYHLDSGIIKGKFKSAVPAVSKHLEKIVPQSELSQYLYKDWRSQDAPCDPQSFDTAGAFIGALPPLTMGDASKKNFTGGVSNPAAEAVVDNECDALTTFNYGLEMELPIVNSLVDLAERPSKTDDIVSSFLEENLRLDMRNEVSGEERLASGVDDMVGIFDDALFLLPSSQANDSATMWIRQMGFSPPPSTKDEDLTAPGAGRIAPRTDCALRVWRSLLESLLRRICYRECTGFTSSRRILFSLIEGHIACQLHHILKHEITLSLRGLGLTCFVLVKRTFLQWKTAVCRLNERRRQISVRVPVGICLDSLPEGNWSCRIGIYPPCSWPSMAHTESLSVQTKDKRLELAIGPVNAYGCSAVIRYPGDIEYQVDPEKTSIMRMDTQHPQVDHLLFAIVNHSTQIPFSPTEISVAELVDFTRYDCYPNVHFGDVKLPLLMSIVGREVSSVRSYPITVSSVYVCRWRQGSTQFLHQLHLALLQHHQTLFDIQMHQLRLWLKCSLSDMCKNILALCGSEFGIKRPMPTFITSNMLANDPIATFGLLNDSSGDPCGCLPMAANEIQRIDAQERTSSESRAPIAEDPQLNGKVLRLKRKLAEFENMVEEVDLLKMRAVD